VVPGDVIIKGQVRGQGTIYAGRNIHIVGAITYQQAPMHNYSLQRHQQTGEIAVYQCLGGGEKLGWVCDNGDYYNKAGCKVDPATGTPEVPCIPKPANNECVPP
jgi:hypothetical protein